MERRINGSSRASDVVAQYPDGTPALTQGKFGNGSVMLLGTHPEAPDDWLKAVHARTSSTAARVYAARLISAALEGTPLQHY